MLKINKEIAVKRFRSLSPILQEAIFSAQTAEIIGMVCEKNHIPKEKISDIAEITGFVLLGFIHPEDLPKEVNEKTGLDIKIAQLIKEDLQIRLFNLIKDSIDKAYLPLQSNTAKIPAPTQGGPKIISTNTVVQPIGSVRTEVKENPKITPPTLTPFQLRTNQGTPTTQTPSKIPMPNAVNLRGAMERVEVKDSNTLNLKNTIPVSTPKDQTQTPPPAPINPVKITPQPAAFEARREIPNASVPVKSPTSEPVKNPIQNSTPTVAPIKPIGQEVNIFEQLKNLEKSGSELVNVLRTREEKNTAHITTPIAPEPLPIKTQPTSIPTPTPTPIVKPTMGPVMIHQETKVAPITQKINQTTGNPRPPFQPTNQIGAINQNSGSLNLNQMRPGQRDANPGWLKAIFGKPSETETGPIKTVSFSEKEELQKQPTKAPQARPVVPEPKQNIERPNPLQNVVKPIQAQPVPTPAPTPIAKPTTMDIHQPGDQKKEPMIDLGTMKRL